MNVFRDPAGNEIIELPRWSTLAPSRLHTGSGEVGQPRPEQPELDELDALMIRGAEVAAQREAVIS